MITQPNRALRPSVREADLISTFLRLWHMATDGSWPSIKEHGLRSTSSLLDLYRRSGDERVSIEARHRPESRTLKCAGLTPETVRDQRPMSEARLRECLVPDVTPCEW